jgi:hypothetical protein
VGVVIPVDASSSSPPTVPGETIDAGDSVKALNGVSGNENEEPRVGVEYVVVESTTTALVDGGGEDADGGGTAS